MSCKLNYVNGEALCEGGIFRNLSFTLALLLIFVGEN